MRYLFLLTLSALLFAAPYQTKQYKEPHAKGLIRTVKSRGFLDAKKTARRAKLTGQAPASYDLTARVSPPENQGQCGSCWDFGITKALRSALMLVGKDPGRLAFNYLLNNCGPGPQQSGCNGGDFDAGQSMLNSLGPWLESQDPYQGYETRCKSGLSVAGTGLTYEVVGNGKNAPSFQDLALALSQNHELVVDVAVCGDWENYSSGIFNSNQCGSNSINHIINMNGYDCETSVDAQGNCKFDSKGEPVNGDGFLIAMNNWGTSWGENGLMRTRAHVDAIADTAMYFTVVQPPPPPTPTPVPPTPVPPTPVPPAPAPSGLNWVDISGFAALGIGIILMLIYAVEKLKGDLKK